MNGDVAVINVNAYLFWLSHVVHGSVSLQLFPVQWIFLRSLGVICHDT